MNLHKIKKAILLDCTGDFKLKRLMVIGHFEQKTNIRFRNMNDVASYINAIDIDFESKDVTFTGFVHNTSQFNVVRRNAYSRGTNYMKEFIEYHRQNCFIPTPRMCFINCIVYFTKKEYTDEFGE